MWEKDRVDGIRKLKHNAIPTLFSFTKPNLNRKPPKKRSVPSPIKVQISEANEIIVPGSSESKDPQRQKKVLKRFTVPSKNLPSGVVPVLASNKEKCVTRTVGKRKRTVNMLEDNNVPSTSAANQECSCEEDNIGYSTIKLPRLKSRTLPSEYEKISLNNNTHVKTAEEMNIQNLHNTITSDEQNDKTGSNTQEDFENEERHIKEELSGNEDMESSFLEEEIDIKDEFVTPDENYTNLKIESEDSLSTSSEEEEPTYQTEKVFIKEEFVASEDDTNEQFCPEFVNCGSVSTDSDIKDKILNKPQVVQCYICDKEFLHKRSLKIHLETHADLRRYECQVCHKKFIRKFCMREHVKLHSDVKDFMCTVCNKTFKQKKYLKQHERVHTKDQNIKPVSVIESKAEGSKNTFECSICNSKFTRKYSLMQHQNIHTGVKEFECTICNKKFARKDKLKRHAVIHSNVEDFECSSCNKRFTHKSRLMQHEKVHAGIKTYECSFCKKQFNHKTNWTEHEKIHTATRDFECSICNKKFIRERSLKKHEKKHT